MHRRKLESNLSMGKKDLNYVAKLEKAIAEKYGAETIQSPKSSWTDEKEAEYLEQLKLLAEKERISAEKNEKTEVNGVLIPKKLLNKDSNRICETCGVYSFKSIDDVYMSKYSCCYKCFVQHVEHREERWEEGWRPQKD